jgi:hypothetical protein
MIEAMKQALDAMKKGVDGQTSIEMDEAITSLRQAIREHAMYEVQRLGQEIEQSSDYERGFIDGMQKQMQSSVDKAVNAMSQREWVGLTDDEIIDVIHPLVMADMSDQATDYEIARAIEAKLKEKNT